MARPPHCHIVLCCVHTAPHSNLHIRGCLSRPRQVHAGHGNLAPRVCAPLPLCECALVFPSKALWFMLGPL